MSHNLREQSTVDYLALENGTISDHVGTQSSSESPPPQKAIVSEGGSPTSEDDCDTEIVQLEARKGLLQTAERREAKNRRREELRREVDELVARSNARSGSQPRGPVSATRSAPCAARELLPPTRPLPLIAPAATFDSVNLRDLRGLSTLNAEVEAELYRAGLCEDQPSVPVGRTTAGKKSNNVSYGRDATIRDTAVTPVVWPQTALKYFYVSAKTDYSKLDLPLLNAGELAIINSDRTSAVERKGRTDLLERINYFSKDYTWAATRAFHEAVLVDIERGARTWTDRDYRDLETGILLRHPLIQQVQQQRSDFPRYETSRQDSRRQQPRKYFCLAFNRGDCHHAGAHEGLISRVSQLVEHFCSLCYRTDHTIKLHPEIRCPQKSSNKV